MHDYSERHPHTEPLTAVIRTAPLARRNRWATIGPLFVGAVGLMLAAATLAMFLIWKGSVTVQISQLRSELAKAQATEASNGAGLAGLTERVRGTNREVAGLESLFGGFGDVCSQDLTGPSGPAVFLFPCQQKG